MNRTFLRSSRGTLTFNGSPFLLHRLDPGAPALRDGIPGERRVEIAGYILPDGKTQGERAEQMQAARRLLCRVTGAPEGYTLCHGGRTVALTADTAPAFSSEAPLCGPDASFFTLRARSDPRDGCMSGETVSCEAQGVSGALCFPFVWGRTGVLGSLSRQGSLTVVNPGDTETGFVLTVTAEGGELSSFSVSRGEASLSVGHTLAPGESMCIDTRPGHKDVAAAGSSILWTADWQSEFFTLLPGENVLEWSCGGKGLPRLTLSFSPRYF